MVRSIALAALLSGAGCFIENVPGVDDPVGPDVSNGPPALVSLAVSDDARCVVHADGAVSCWGSNGSGIFGIPTSERWFSPKPVAVRGIAGAKQVTTSTGACVVKGDGSVWCWGAGGLRGDGTRADEIHPTPVQVAGVSGAVSVSSASYKACAVLANETFSCWGNANDYYIGDGPPLPRAGPITGLTGVVQGSRGDVHACVAHASGTASCWGGNRFGQLGNGASEPSLAQRTPVAVSGLTDAVQLVTGGEASCALHRGGTVSCWGATGLLTGATNAQCPHATGQSACQNVPAAVAGLSNVTQVALGMTSLCVLLADRTVQCLGDNYFGQLGDGTTSSRTTAAPVQGLADVVELAVAGNTMCARRTDHAVLCWGMNASWGEDGAGLQSAVPVEVRW